jgi:hypothetical protein
LALIEAALDELRALRADVVSPERKREWATIIGHKPPCRELRLCSVQKAELVDEMRTLPHGECSPALN